MNSLSTTNGVRLVREEEASDNIHWDCCFATIPQITVNETLGSWKNKLITVQEHMQCSFQRFFH